MTQSYKPGQGSKLSNLPLDDSSAGETKMNKPLLVEVVHDITDEKCDQLPRYVTVIVDRNQSNPATDELTESARCDFSGTSRLKPVKVANQAVSGFTAFTCFDLAKPGKSLYRPVNPDRPKFVSVCGGHYA